MKDRRQIQVIDDDYSMFRESIYEII